MDSMARTKTQSDESVLDAAIAVMLRARGGDFTLAQVAAASGLAPATLMQRFGDKRGLILAAMDRDNARFAEILGAAPRERSVAAVIDLFWGMTPGLEDDEALAEQRLWLSGDMSDPALNGLARARFALLRQAVIERMPALVAPADRAARLLEAQWQGALNQWSVSRQGSLADYVAESLEAWFALSGASRDQAADDPT